MNKRICETFPAMNPIQLLDYTTEDVFDLINGIIDYNNRHNDDRHENNVVRRKAGDDWF